MKHLLSSYRAINAFLVLMEVLAMGFALLFLQKHLGLDPCPLCVFQRVGLMVMGGFCLLAIAVNTHKFWLRLSLWFGGFLGIVWSALVAGRHVWLQYLPADQVPACGPSLDFMMEAFPFMEVFSMVLSGSGQCAKVSWTFLGLSIPEQSIILFSGLIIVKLYLLFVIIKNKAKF